MMLKAYGFEVTLSTGPPSYSHYRLQRFLDCAMRLRLLHCSCIMACHMFHLVLSPD